MFQINGDLDVIIMMKKRTTLHITILTMIIWSRCLWQWLMQNVHDHNINDNDWCRACNEIRKLTVLLQAILQCTTLWTIRQKFKSIFFYFFYYLRFIPQLATNNIQILSNFKRAILLQCKLMWTFCKKFKSVLCYTISTVAN